MDNVKLFLGYAFGIVAGIAVLAVCIAEMIMWSRCL
jgi:hypothetical protein